MPAPRNQATHPAILEAAHTLTAGRFAEAIHDEAARVAATIFDDRSGDPRALPRPRASSVEPDDVVRVVEAALAEAAGASLRDEVARTLMIAPPARSRGRSAVTELLGLITGTTRQGVEARLRLRERLPGDSAAVGATSGCS